VSLCSHAPQQRAQSGVAAAAVSRVPAAILREAADRSGRPLCHFVGGPLCLWRTGQACGGRQLCDGAVVSCMQAGGVCARPADQLAAAQHHGRGGHHRYRRAAQQHAGADPVNRRECRDFDLLKRRLMSASSQAAALLGQFSFSGWSACWLLCAARLVACDLSSLPRVHPWCCACAVPNGQHPGQHRVGCDVQAALLHQSLVVLPAVAALYLLSCWRATPRR
jgi:hypothetical protein